MTTTCEDCGAEFELDLQALRAGYASWRRCPTCRAAKAQENRAKLAQAKTNRVADEERRGAA